MWIQSTDPEDAEGAVKRVYDEAVRRAGRVFQIVRAMSLAPATMAASLELYKGAMHGSVGLTRRQCEMLAVVVSRANDCHY